MGIYKNNILKNILVIIIAFLYISVAISHIYFLQNTTLGERKGHAHSNSIFKRKVDVFYSKVDNLNLVKPLDKSIIENKKAVTDFIRINAECFLTILFVLVVWLLKPKSFNILSRPLINYQNYHLSICILKI
jgi:hypothetical protein